MVVIVRAYSNEFRMRNHERERGREMKKIPTLGQMSGNWDVKKFLFCTLLFLLFSFFFLFLSPRFKSIFKYACYLSAKIEGMFERLNLSRMDKEREREREREINDADNYHNYIAIKRQSSWKMSIRRLCKQLVSTLWLHHPSKENNRWRHHVSIRASINLWTPMKLMNMISYISLSISIYPFL